MPAHFHTLTVKAVHKETADCVVVSFDIPEPVKHLFRYTQGQNITLKKNIGGEEIRRSYSICSAPYENNLRIAIKKTDPGKFSTYANDHLQKGDLLDVLPPSGRFYTPLHTTNSKRYLAIAAGSGITPIISIIKTTLATEPASVFTIILGNRGRGSIIFFEELSALKNRYTERFSLINILSRERTSIPLNFGRINADKLLELQKLVDYENMDEIFICGPGKMLFAAKEFLTERGIAQQKIHTELFTTPDTNSAKNAVSWEKEHNAAASEITILLDGRSFAFDLAFNGESILDAALNKGLDLPFACKGGVCSTCKARLTAGEVKLDVNYALEADELAMGFILTCQSHPLTQKVSIDFDSR